MNTPSDLEKKTRDALAFREEVRNLTKKYDRALNAPRPIRPPLRNFPTLAQISFDPERTRMDTDQHLVYQGLVLGGWPGLIDNVQRQCKRHQADMLAAAGKTTPSDTDPHRYIIEDCDDGSKKMSTILMIMQQNILEAVIEGNVTARSYEDKEFLKIVKGYTQLTATPCIYLNELVNREYVNNTKSKYPGRCLNYYEWRQVLDTLAAYKDQCTRTPKTALVTSIQAMVSDRSRPHLGIDRYLPSQESFHKLQTFIDSNWDRFVAPGERLFLQNSSDPLLDIPFKRVPREIGWGLYGYDRAHQHATQQQTSWLFGLFDSTIRYLFGANRFECKSYMIIPIPKPELAQFAEYFASQAGFTYWYQGAAGLNPELAGTIPMQASNPGQGKAITLAKYAPLFAQVTRNLVQQGEMDLRIEEQRSKEYDNNALAGQMSRETVDQMWDRIEKRQHEVKTQLKDLTNRAEALVYRSYTDRFREIRDRKKS